MAQVILFHHALGLTPGVQSFAQELRDAGHVVHTPDLFDGRTFEQVPDGVHHAAEEVGFDAIIDRGRVAAEALPTDVVYAGFSMGVMPAQMLAQARPGARGALLFHSALPPSEFGGSWPADLPAQIHIMEHDADAIEGGDMDAARRLAAEAERVELFLYPGEGHLFADPASADYDQAAASELRRRALEFLAMAG